MALGTPAMETKTGKSPGNGLKTAQNGTVNTSTGLFVVS